MSSLKVDFNTRPKLLLANRFGPNTAVRARAAIIGPISGFELFKFIDKYLFVPVTRGRPAA